MFICIAWDAVEGRQISGHSLQQIVHVDEVGHEARVNDFAILVFFVLLLEEGVRVRFPRCHVVGAQEAGREQQKAVLI